MLTFEPLNTFIVTLLLLYFLKNKAAAIGLVDRPDSRKVHHGDVPLIGGLAIFAACLMSLYALAPAPTRALAFFSGGAVLVLIGSLDDYFSFAAVPRFVAQICAAWIIAAVGGVVVADLGHLLPGGGLVELGIWSLPFTIFATVGVINALNMVDGIDGLSGSLTLVALTGLAVAAALAGEFHTLRFLAMFISGVAAFLVYNLRLPGRRQAAVFLGDAGSMFLGFTLAWFIIGLSQAPSHAISPAAGLWFLMVPLFDTVFVMLRRMLRGQSPFRADRQHLHHYLMALGFSVNQTVLIIVGFAALGVAFGLAGVIGGWPDYFLFTVFLGLFALYSTVMSRAWRHQQEAASLTQRHPL